MKKLILLFLFAGILSCQYKTDPQKLLKETNTTINQIQQHLLPDKRDRYFEISAIYEANQLVLKGQTDFKVLKDSVLNTLKTKNINVLDSVKLLPDPVFKNKKAITRLSVANLRANPKHSAELVTQTLMGMPLTLLDKQNGFYLVKTPENYYAWVNAAGLKILNDNDYKKTMQRNKIIITALCGNAMQKPNEHALPVSDYVMNDVFDLVNRFDDFAQIQYPDGRQAYINIEDYLNFDQFQSMNNFIEPADIVDLAKEFLGRPYLWGGTSSKGMDCSGFTKTVYAQFGFLLPRDASQQAKIGKAIQLMEDFSNLQPGDLLFFGRKEHDQNKITHVAIHINNGKIIHATGEVKIESLNSNDADYNIKRHHSLLAARRVLNHYPQNLLSIYQ